MSLRDTRTENILVSLKVKFAFVPDYPLTSLVSDEETQVRFEVNRAPKRDVDRYRGLLTAGAEFPPIVTNKAGQIIDGNTRWGAYTACRRHDIPAYVCDISSPVLARRIGVELNAMAGKRMEKEEMVSWLRDGNGSVTEEDALRITGWSADTIRRTRGALQFEARRTKLSISLTTALPDTVKHALNRVTDPGCFEDLTRLADDAGLRPTEINMIGKQANEASRTDVPAARRIISDYRADCGQRIEDRQAGLRRTTPFFQHLSMHAGWIIKQGASGLHDVNTHTGPKSRLLIEEALDTLREAAERYQ